MNFKRFVEADNSWVDSHYIKKTDTDIITTLPATIYPLAQTATIGLKGNTVQSGTPTPDNPVMPQGTGERTGNLLPEFYATSGEISDNSYTITKNSIETHNDGSILGAYYVLTEFKRYGNYANYTIIDEQHSFKIPAGTYTFSGNENIHSGNNGLRLIVGQLGQTVMGATAGAINVGVGQTFTINEDSYVCPVLEIRYDSKIDEYILTNPMLNLGSTALPYEPYGVKIPILSAGQTSNIYLGEVPTTRLIKKLVLTGEEKWEYAATNLYTLTLTQTGTAITDSPSAYCTHFVGVASISSYSQLYSDQICIRSTGTQIWVRSSNITTAADFKTYLAQQYTAGTPVTVWYVLATPTTGIVNEPIRKIGDYADTVSGITIPTITGKDTFDVETTLKPSEVTVNYKGWHPVADVHERESGAWT